MKLSKKAVEIERLISLLLEKIVSEYRDKSIVAGTCKISHLHKNQNEKGIHCSFYHEEGKTWVGISKKTDTKLLAELIRYRLHQLVMIALWGNIKEFRIDLNLETTDVKIQYFLEPR